MKKGAEEVKSGSSLRKGPANFNIDKMTLSRYVNNCKSQPQPIISYDAILLSNFVVSPAMATDLDQPIKTSSDMFHGVGIEKCKQDTYEFATRNKSKLPSSWDEKKKARKSW